MDEGLLKPQSVLKPTNLFMIGVRAAAIACAASIIGILYNLGVNPRSIPFFAHKQYDVYVICEAETDLVGIERVSSKDLAQSTAEGRTIIDARPPGDFYRGHIPGAISIPHDTLACPHPETVQMLKGQNQQIVVYGNGSPDTGRLLAEELQREGVPRVAYLEGGFSAWLDAGMPVQKVR